MKNGVIQGLNTLKKEYLGAKSIFTLISLMRMANSLLKESQKQKHSNLNFMEYTNNGSLFAKFAQVNFSG